MIYLIFGINYLIFGILYFAWSLNYLFNFKQIFELSFLTPFNFFKVSIPFFYFSRQFDMCTFLFEVHPRL